MAEMKFGPNSPAYYGDVVKADRPKSSGLTLVPINRYSGRPVVDTDVGYYGNNPADVVERLYKDGIPAQGFINNKFYRDGQELSAEQVQAQPIQNVIGIEGPLATLGLRTPVGPGGEKFIRDAAAEKKFAASVRESAKRALQQGSTIIEAGVAFTARPGGMSDKDYANYLIKASDEEIIANVGGVNKEGITGSNFGINTKLPFPEGTVNTQYVQGSRAITQPDILALGKIVGNAANDPQAAANASRQLISIFENDASFVRREQARDALSYGLPGYPGGAEAAVTPVTVSTDSQGVVSAPARTYTALDGLDFTDQQAFATYQSALMADKRAQLAAEQQAAYAKAGERAGRQSAFDELYNEMSAIGLGSLVDPLRGFIEQDIPPSEFAIKLRDTEAYQKRFIANQARISKGLRALTPGEYIKNEDGYRQALRAYGLSQFDNDQYVTQFIENDVSPTELSNRLSLAVQRVQNADPAIARTLRDYYGITQQDLVGYVLDPKQQLPALERKVATAEIGAAARIQGLEPGAQVAGTLAAQGVTQAEAQKGYAKIASILPTAEKLSQIYGATMEGYDLTQAEQETFNQLASAQRRRERLSEREIAAFSGQSGLGRTSLTQAQGGQF